MAPEIIVTMPVLRRAETGIVVFDPGHTPTRGAPAIPSVRLENPAGWEWYQDRIC